MKNGKTLLHSNKYLRNAKQREALIVRHAVISARIEGAVISRKMLKRVSASASAKRTLKRA